MLAKSKKHYVKLIVLSATISMGLFSTWIFQRSKSSSVVNVAMPAVEPGIVDAAGPQTFLPLTKNQAIEANEDLPFAHLSLQVAEPFFYPTTETTATSRRSALECLASAIYYEAGNEGVEGKRAVAQVVLNRVKHPAFPNRVCGVVYQGAERRSGCQFTFTCDGSLSRNAARNGWQSALQIAADALNGYVQPAVGMATHYHANYVVPYWASSLDKVAAIDTHIFYNWKGSWGRRAAFSARLIPELGIEAPLGHVRLEIDTVPTEELLDFPDLQIERMDQTSFDLAADTQSADKSLEADRQSGRLKIDETGSILRIDSEQKAAPQVGLRVAD